MRMAYEPCLTIAGKQVPSGPDWIIHEVKHDGYRMLVIRENHRVRLLSCSVDDVLPTQMTAPAHTEGS
jgi:bifunctional non-homologous end joining protein LigD